MSTRWSRLHDIIAGNRDATPVATVATVAGGSAPGSRGAPPVAATGGVTGLSHCFYNATGATVRKQAFRDDVLSGPEFQSVRTAAAPATPVTSVATVADNPIVASDRLAAVPAALPDEWKDGMRRFADMQPLPGFSPTVWRQAVIDGHQLLHENGTAAFVMGWTLEDLFGLHPECPALRVDAMGLAFLMRGRRILRFGEFMTTIELPRGGETVYRRANAGAVVAWSWRVTS
jgi:hypothetical protein